MDGDGPLVGGVVPGGGGDGGLHPDVELEELGVGGEPVGELVLGGVDGPVWGEVLVGHVVVPDWVVQHELAVALAPVVADVVVSVDDEGGDVEHLETSCGG